VQTRGRSRLLAAAAVCLAAGLALAGWSVVQIHGETSAQQQLVQRWRQSLPATGVTSPSPVTSAPSPSPLPVPPVPAGKWFLMRVPGTGYAEMVRQGVSDEILYLGPGHYPDTAWPGWPGNVGVGVHNTYWLGVGKLEPGRTVVLETEYGVFTYRISTSSVVAADTLGLFTQIGPQRLTLTTCWPLWAGAAATQRLVMVGDQVAATWRIPWPPPA
jgi:sortase A